MERRILQSRLLHSFAAENIKLVEWENQLLRRLGYPIVVSDSIYLVQDEQLPRARDIAFKSGLRPATKDTSNPCYSFEFAKLGHYFSLKDYAPGTYFARYLILVPLSWTGVSLSELHYIEPPEPTSLGVLTLSLPVACAALMRLAARERRSSSLRLKLLADLASIIAYSFFDMSYEGDYMIFKADDEADSEAERAEMEAALLEIKRWSWRKDELWMGEALAAVVAGTMSYDDLPYLESN